MSNNIRPDDDFKSDLWEVSKFLLGCSWQATKFLAKNTPKAIVTIAQVKREIFDLAGNEVREYQKQQKEDELNERIRKLKKSC
jgi:hypothetical protein